MNAPAIPKTLPSAEDVALARESGRALSTVLQTRADTQQIDFHDDKGAVRTVRIPTSALRLLLEVLTEIGQGNAVSVIPIHAELTTQEAADVLGISRSTLVRMLEAGELPFERIRRHRRLYLSDVLEYRERQRRASDEALSDMVADAQAMGAYDNDPAEVREALAAVRAEK